MRRIGLLPSICALVLATLAATSPAAAQSVRACGVERWPVKVALDADVARVDTVAERTTVAHLASLPRPYVVESRGRAAPYELTTYVVTARVLELFREEDSDWHIVLGDTAAGAPATIIAELPSAECAYGSRYQSRFAALAPVADSLRPGAIVDVTGLGFFDVPHGQRGVAPNAFELHPIVGLRVLAPGARGLARGARPTGAGVAPGALVGTDTVWVNTRSSVYHCRGSRWYGRTSRGYYARESDAVAAGARPAYGRTCGGG